VQLARVVMVQVVPLQQAPIAPMHGLIGAQVVPVPWKPPGGGQPPAVVVVQVVPLQHAPVWHGSGLQVIPSPW
jgi:hypothetical protein